MAELLKSESPVSQSLQDITEALKIVVDDGVSCKTGLS